MGYSPHGMMGEGTRAGLVLAIALAAASSGHAQVVTPIEADRMRVQRHLRSVEEELRRVSTEQLPASIRQARERALRELRAYWTAGTFPKNSGHPNLRRPYFIDHEGTACAVAHLLIESGSERLAQEFDQRFHTAYVSEMSEPRLEAWATKHGFTIAELARIQPSYCACGGSDYHDAGDLIGDNVFDPVCGDDGLTYWNRCTAQICGDVSVVHEGACEYGFDICETCEFGKEAPIVDDCAYSTTDSLCGHDSASHAVSWRTGARDWLEFQNACQDPDAELIDPTFCANPVDPVAGARDGGSRPTQEPTRMDVGSPVMQDGGGDAKQQASSNDGCTVSAPGLPARGSAWACVVLLIGVWWRAAAAQRRR